MIQNLGDVGDGADLGDGGDELIVMAKMTVMVKIL